LDDPGVLCLCEATGEVYEVQVVDEKKFANAKEKIKTVGLRTRLDEVLMDGDLWYYDTQERF